MSAGHSFQGVARKPDAAQIAQQAFSSIDTQGKGYIDESSFTEAVKSMGGPAMPAGSTVQMFKAMDQDSDGRVTQQEMQKNLEDMFGQIEQRFSSMGGMGGMGGMPPMMPMGMDGAQGGLDREQLGELSQSLSGTDASMSSSIDQLVQNFDAADLDGDGRVSAQEAMQFAQQNAGQGGGSSGASGGGLQELDGQLARTLLQLARSYEAIGSSDTGQRNPLLSVSA